mmetsp:Transcript_6273/g.6871  ORF Transcript_6273/g.6871 Transcript_6273/m.6871 type:complete len:81 (+) Transcript_6273:402-644(+)
MVVSFDRNSQAIHQLQTINSSLLFVPTVDLVARHPITSLTSFQPACLNASCSNTCLILLSFTQSQQHYEDVFYIRNPRNS